MDNDKNIGLQSPGGMVVFHHAYSLSLPGTLLSHLLHPNLISGHISNALNSEDEVVIFHLKTSQDENK